MNIQTATSRYERWLAKQLTIVPADLQQKHQDMADDAFRFLRATYYRWAQRWPVVCSELSDGALVLAVGDLHVENFGTWRDLFARLVWGVNDFDEAFPLAYTNDLVRLATSVRLAALTGHISIRPSSACEAILAGYRRGLEKGTEPFILDHKHRKLRRLALGELREPSVFWRKMEMLPQAKGTVPNSAVQVLEQALPEDCQYLLKTRRAGEGSLGRQRFVALAHWKGGYVARESKAIAPSANYFALDIAGKPQLYYRTIVEKSARCPDPCLTLTDKWIVRRLSPDCSRIELSQLAAIDDEYVLLKAMGRETANVHAAATAVSRAVQKDLNTRPDNWLQKASAAMADDVLKDWRVWRQFMRS